MLASVLNAPLITLFKVNDKMNLDVVRINQTLSNGNIKQTFAVKLLENWVSVCKWQHYVLGMPNISEQWLEGITLWLMIASY